MIGTGVVVVEGEEWKIGLPVGGIVNALEALTGLEADSPNEGFDT